MDAFFGLDYASKQDAALDLLTTVYDRGQLMIVEGLLRDARIPYLAKERGSGTMVKVIAGYSIFGTDIFVPRELCETAAELIALVEPPEQEALAEEEEEEEEI